MFDSLAQQMKKDKGRASTSGGRMMRRYGCMRWQVSL
jgi:hypothetical protein